MKNQFTSRIVKFTFAFMFILTASSCSEDNDAMDAAVLAKEINSEISAKGGKVSTQSTFKDSEVILPSCLDCISERVLFEDNTSDQVGNSANYKNVNYQIWNTPTQLIVQTTNTFATDKVDIVVNGVTYTNDPSSDIPAGQAIYTYFNLPEGYTACQYTLTSVKVYGGPQAELTGIDYGVYVYCPEGCDESFSYAANEDGSYTFTYIPEENMSDANLVFTFPQGTYVSGLDDWATPGVTMQKTMNLVACETYTWTVVLKSNCKGIFGAQDKGNVFTDFKVNDVSRKGNVDKIEIACTPD